MAKQVTVTTKKTLYKGGKKIGSQQKEVRKTPGKPISDNALKMNELTLRNANIAQGIAQAGQIGRDAIDAAKQTAISKNSLVQAAHEAEQLVNSGLTEAAPVRDEDKDSDPNMALEGW